MWMRKAHQAVGMGLARCISMNLHYVMDSKGYFMKHRILARDSVHLASRPGDRGYVRHVYLTWNMGFRNHLVKQCNLAHDLVDMDFRQVGKVHVPTFTH